MTPAGSSCDGQYGPRYGGSQTRWNGKTQLLPLPRSGSNFPATPLRHRFRLHPPLEADTGLKPV